MRKIRSRPNSTEIVYNSFKDGWFSMHLENIKITYVRYSLACVYVYMGCTHIVIEKPISNSNNTIS